jgi:hypothetical protein
MFVLLVIDDANEEGELREIVGPFASRAAAAKYREGVEADRFEVVELTDPNEPRARG